MELINSLFINTDLTLSRNWVIYIVRFTLLTEASQHTHLPQSSAQVWSMQIQSPAESSSLTWSMQIHFFQQLMSSPFTMVSAETLSNKVVMLHSGQCRTICQHNLHPSQWPMQIHCPTRSSCFTVVSADPSTVQKGLHFSQWLMPIQCLHPSQWSVQRDPLSNTVFTLHSG